MPASVHQGSTFGLLIESDRAVPGLAQPHRPGPADLVLNLGHIPPRFLPSPTAAPTYRPPEALGRAEIDVFRVDAGYYMRFEDGCAIACDAGATRAWCAWPEPFELSDAAIYLLGPFMALALRLRGRTVLHAAAVSVGETAVAIVGGAGAGKSTTSAALVDAGFPLVTDDVLALAEDGAGIRALPGGPLARLWDDSAQALRDAPLPLLTPNWGKRYLDLAAQAERAWLPLSRIYLLEDRDPEGPARRAPLAGSEALMRILANLYHGWLADRADRVRDLQRLGRLLGTVPVVRLIPGEGLERLDEVIDLIRDDLTR